MCCVVGGDNHSCRSTQTSVDGSTVYIQDFPSRRCKYVVVIVSCPAVWLSWVTGSSDGHRYRSQELMVSLHTVLLLNTLYFMCLYFVSLYLTDVGYCCGTTRTHAEQPVLFLVWLLSGSGWREGKLDGWSQCFETVGFGDKKSIWP